MTTARLQARVDPHLKMKAEEIMKKFGMTPSKLFTVIYAYIVQSGELPIDMKKIPNITTVKAIKDAQNLGPFMSGDELINDLNS
jgi:addiction module RelB/DinJ family antitoxin